MHIKNRALSLNEIAILYPAFLALGVNKYEIYLTIFVIYILFIAHRLINERITYGYLILSGLLLIAIIPLYIVGYDKISLESPYRSMLVMIFSTVIAGFSLQKQSRKIQYNLIIAYILGIGISSLIISGYSIYTDPLVYGYGVLYNPFTGQEINSPGVSNNLAIFSSLLVYLLFRNINTIYKFTILLVLVCSIVIAISLGGRAYFVILLLAFIILSAPSIFRLELKLLIIISFFMALLLLISSWTLENIEQFDRYYVFMEKRLEVGLESKRFEHYLDGVNKLFNYPFGGFDTNPSIENTKYFHNVFLDGARLAGWIPTTALMLMTLFIAILFAAPKDIYSYFGFFVCIVCFLIMQQDVVIEGNSQSLILMYYSGILIVGRKIVIFKINAPTHTTALSTGSRDTS